MACKCQIVLIFKHFMSHQLLIYLIWLARRTPDPAVADSVPRTAHVVCAHFLQFSFRL